MNVCTIHIITIMSYSIHRQERTLQKFGVNSKYWPEDVDLNKNEKKSELCRII